MEIQTLDDSVEIIDYNVPVSSQKGRKNIRSIKESCDLNLETKIAIKNEKERLKRIELQEEKLLEIECKEKYENDLILDYDYENKSPLVSVHKTLVKKLKTHQKKGVKFMWNACYESLKQIKQSDGSGCILAHCMGLGKSFQVITLVHTLLNNTQTGTQTVLICCPKNTLLNWINEFQMWITPDMGLINLYNPTRFENYVERLNELIRWKKNGGVCVINYELFRILLEDDLKQLNVKIKNKFEEHLSNPGPDLIVCDEGHVLKSEDTKLSKIMNRVRTLRRIVLTGTPMQNNLIEYYCMVNFVKPNLLGTRNEFTNMFVNPILNGQYENSLDEDVQIMKERSHILHKKLLGCVQRFDLSTLKSFLPEKQEYVILVALTKPQIEMYRYYLDTVHAKRDWKNQSVALFSDYQFLQRIWTHPYSLKVYGEKHQEESSRGRSKKKRKKKSKEMTESDYDSSDSSDFNLKLPLSWWVQFVSYDELQDANISGKLIVFLNILKECEELNEKLLVFSGSLYSLEVMEYFLKKINFSKFEDPALCNMTSTWEVEQDYLVLTGKTSSEDRDRFCKSFNNKNDKRLRLFLISIKAGGMGINLTAANRAVLFDVSWNPSHDIQSIFRIYRIGQTKPCFVYRLVASGTMEEKIYERQVAKQSISFRVLDEKQIARHFTERELLELYQFNPKKDYKTNVTKPRDCLLQKILQDNSEKINGIHEHDSLLEHKQEEELLEIEKNDAWTAFDNLNDFENLPESEKEMLKNLKPESFDPECFKKVLQEKYKKASEEEIIALMADLLPRIERILKSPDFINIMKREAILYQNKRVRPASKRVRNKINKTIEVSYESFTIPSQEQTLLPHNEDSDSDDSIFLFEIKRKSGRKTSGKKIVRKPINAWGVRNGKEFGCPEKDSS